MDWIICDKYMFRLAEIFTDHMVLQRDKKIKVFGFGDEKVAVTFRGAAITAEPSNGKWCVTLPACNAGGPYELKVEGKDRTIVLTDILVGDVWIASGQSNMEMPLLLELRGVEEAKNSYNENIRFYTCNRSTNTNIKQTLWAFEKIEGKFTPWVICCERNALHFSAIGYYVAKLLYAKLGIPIGIISANKGASVIDTWVPKRAFETELYKPYLDMYKKMQICDEEADAAYCEYVNQMNEVTYKHTMNIEKLVLDMGVEAATVKKLETPLPELALCKYHYNAPGKLYDIIISRQIAPMSVSGVLWYQGESSRQDRNYADKFRLMAKYWREDFEDEHLAFYTVEIAPFAYGDVVPFAAYLRAEQWRAAEITENTYISSTQDLGDEFDIHPNRKYEISRRITNQILNYSYRVKNYCESPSFLAYNIVANKVYITLKNDAGFFGCDNGINMRICGTDNTYIPAESKYENGKLVVWNDQITRPINVRYCFDSYYRRGRYFNKSGLPLAPFSTELKR